MTPRDDVPFVWCDPTCPRQWSLNASDCECGGARREWEAVRAARRENRPDPEIFRENRPTSSPQPNRPTETLDHDEQPEP